MCVILLTAEVPERLAHKAKAPYSYVWLLCTGVQKFNANNPDEGAFNMGSSKQQRSELAAFFGNALHKSNEFRAGGEYL